MENKITINEKEYTLKYTIRALIIFEQIKGEMFQIKTLTDEYIFLYCLIMANNKDVNMTFEDLLDAIDKDENIMKSYQEFMLKESEKQKLFMNDEESDDSKKKE